MEFVRIRRRERDSMLRFQKDGKVMDVCSELQASVFRKNGWKSMEVESVDTETDGIEVVETPEEVEATEEIPVALEKPPVKRGRKPVESK